MDIYTLISFVLITSITPGPNNISSLSFSMALGYKSTLKYILGIVLGTIIVLLICAFLASTLAEYFPEFKKYLGYFGAIYITYLAYKIARINPQELSSSVKAASFLNGAMLQLVNPKALMYGITLYSTFLAGLQGNYLQLVLSAVMLSGITFLCVSTWAISGSIIQKYMRSRVLLRIVTSSMAILLLWFAAKIIFWMN